MGKLILISESDLRELVKEAVTNAVDNITKKIAPLISLLYLMPILKVITMPYHS